MRRKLAIAAVVVGGVVLGTASPATAVVHPDLICHYYQGEYVGATSIHSGVYFSPAQITEQGCNSQ